jgi:hypothetical protein
MSPSVEESAAWRQIDPAALLRANCGIQGAIRLADATIVTPFVHR